MGSFTPELENMTTDRDAPKTVSAVAVLTCAWPALLLATVCLLPYLNKPFNIDDPWFLTMAQQIIKNPAHPMDFRICWNDGLSYECRNVNQFASGNALMGQLAQGYVLVPTVLTGAHEWIAHLTEIFLVWIAVLAMASLVLRFGWERQHAIAGTLLLVAIAPFLPMASTAMPDILATALALVAMERLAAWKAEQKWSQGGAAAIALGLAGFARSHLVLLLPLAAFFLLESIHALEILEQIRRKPWLWTPVFAGSALLIVIVFAFRERNLANPLPHVAVNWRNVPRNLFTYFLYLTFPLPLASCWLANRLQNRRWPAPVILFATGAIAALLLRLNPFAVAFSVVGCGVLSALFFEAWKRRDTSGLFLILWVLIPLPVVCYVQLPIKLLLPCMPAVILLCFRLVEDFSARVIRVAAIGLIVASTGYSLLILRSDAEFAQFGRDALYRLITPHVAAGEKVWFGGQYWSYWYAPLAGAALTVPGGPQPKPGDLLVVDVLSGLGHPPSERFANRTLVDSISHQYKFGRTMGAGVGLYANGSGYWLWGFGDSGRDRYELWRIN